MDRFGFSEQMFQDHSEGQLVCEGQIKNNSVKPLVLRFQKFSIKSILLAIKKNQMQRDTAQQVTRLYSRGHKVARYPEVQLLLERHYVGLSS